MVLLNPIQTVDFTGTVLFQNVTIQVQIMILRNDNAIDYRTNYINHCNRFKHGNYLSCLEGCIYENNNVGIYGFIPVEPLMTMQ